MNHQIGIRKQTNRSKVRYWFVINAKVIDALEGNVKTKWFSNTRHFFSRAFIDDPYWILFILLTIIVNMLITINCFPYSTNQYFIELSVIVHLTCLIYWIDFLVALSVKISNVVIGNDEKTRKIQFFVLDTISLLPLSLLYLLVQQNINYQIFWMLRSVTLLRFYRIPLFLSTLATVERCHWKIFVLTYAFYTVILIDIFTNYWIMQKNITYNINGWNETGWNTFVVAIYFSITTCMNVGFGDTSPKGYFQMIVCNLFMILGFVITTGVLNGAFATGIANQEKKREIYRIEYESTMAALKNSKIDKKIIEKISYNSVNYWRLRRGLTTASPIHILPLSMQKEITFDLNFGFLNRSLIFSLQPRSFLRSVSLMMRNMTLSPGDVIMEPFGLSEAMICVVSGVIEILSEENDETPLLSFTTGTIIGEASLFMSIPIRCIIRASTNVDLQVLKKGNFSRLALKYTDIYRSMRVEIQKRIKFSSMERPSEMDSDVYDLTRRKTTKRLLQELRKSRKEDRVKETTYSESYKADLLDLYVLSENIPRVKTLPINLIRAKPWILRPNTPLTKLWDFFIVIIVLVVSYSYPYLASFVRRITAEIYVMLIFIEIIYIIDLYIQCTTAIERNDNFTYITSIKEIIIHKLKSVQFYVDILATYDLTVYANFVIPSNPDYASLLLSLNRLLKFYHIPRYFLKLENNMNIDLRWLRPFKYLIYYSVAVFWSGAIIYLEACPGENCITDRWYAELAVQEVNASNPSPSTLFPNIISLYWGSVIVSAVGYGDITARAIPDCLAVIFCIILGVFIVIYCTAEASATLKHLERNRTHYQEEVFAVNRFMMDHEIPKELQKDVRNYFRMQWNYDKAFSLKHHLTIESLPIQQREVILMEVMKKFLTVPVFQQADTDFLRLVAKSCRIRVLGPNEVITYAGNLVRDLYILENGYCEITAEGQPRSFIGPLTPFGYIEMILGIPQSINVRTLTHARIISLDYASYLRAVTKYPNVKLEVDPLTKKIYTSSKIKANPIEIFSLNPFPNETTSHENAAAKPYYSKQIINVYRYHKIINSNYWEPFSRWGKFRFFQFFLLPFVLSPHGLTLKIWAIVRIVCVLIIGFVVPVHFSLCQHTPYLKEIIYILQVVSWIDIYINFHVAYYDRRGLLMFHPAKTATWYLKNNFILDLVTAFPFYLIIQVTFERGEIPTFFYDGPGFIMVLQFYKFFQACYYLENDILEAVPSIKIIKFVPLSLIVTNIITGLLILLECQTTSASFPKYSPNKNLMNEFQESIKYFCNNNISTPHTDHNGHNPLRFYLLAYYWVTATMTTCGFGDLAAHNITTMIAVMIIIVLGLFLYGYMFASLTSSMISVYNSVTKYRRRIRDMSKFMKYMNADNDIQRRLIWHYEYNWRRTEGTSPHKMFLYVHPSLRETIMTSMYEDTIRQVPAFINIETSVFRVIGKYSEEKYFLGGEVIMRYNDILEYIYIIYRGKVDVLSQEGRYITSMGSGGIFGNITRNPFALSSVTVVAKRNVDILKLNTEMFFKALQIFPNTKSVLEFFYSRTTDYIQPLEVRNDERVNDSNNAETGTDITRVDTVPYDIFLRSLSPMIQYSDMNVNENENQSCFKNSIYLPANKRISRMVILHDSWLSVSIGRKPESIAVNRKSESIAYRISIPITEIFIFLISYISSTLTFYVFTFQDFTPAILIMSYTLDVLFILKIVYQLNVTHSDKYGNYVVNKQNIKKRYFQEKKNLIFDIVSNLPLDFGALLVSEEHSLLALSIFRLNRILRLYYNIEFYDSKYRKLMINKIYLKLSWIFFNSLLLINFLACIWYFITCPLGYKLEPTWVTLMGMTNATNFQRYIVSIYYIVTLTTTTGYGDIMIISSIEITTSTIYMIMCRFFVALLAGSMAAVISVHSLNLFIYQELISDLRENLCRQNLSTYQLDKFWHYVTSLWSKKSLRKIPKFIETAPHVMKCEVMNSMFGQHLSQCYAFFQSDDAFLKHLATHLKRFIYFTGNYVVHQGDIDNTMYFIHKGQVSVLTIHPDMTETIHFRLEEGDHFGMEQGLIIGMPHHFSYRAETEVEILSLTLSHWQRLLKYFPAVAQSIYQRLQALPELIGKSNVDE